jgi:adenine-specific DNA-methyltransferase
MASLLEQIPKIVADGKREAERIMERLECNNRIDLQTRELVIPSRDTNAADMLVKADQASHDLDHKKMNRLLRRQPSCHGGPTGGKKCPPQCVAGWT